MNSKKQNIVIVSPIGSSGGIIVLRKLGTLLSERGFNVKMYSYHQVSVSIAPSMNPFKKHRLKYLLKFHLKNILSKFKLYKDFRESLFLLKEKLLPIVSKKTIVIYPEIVCGNPLHAKKIVRWFLYYNRYPSNPNAYSKDELVFTFRDIFNDINFNPTCRLLKVNHFNSELYKQTNFGERKGNCYIIRKGNHRIDLPKKFDGPIIDDLPEREKVKILNECKCCYVYDTQTFYTAISCVCGCIPIVVMEPGKTKADYMGKGDYCYGIAYGDTKEEIEYAIKTREKKIKMLDYENSNKKNVSFFLKEIEKFL